MSEQKDTKALKLKDSSKDVKKKDAKKKPDKKKSKFNILQKLREMAAELKKVTWPSKKELLRHSLVVIVFVVVITAVIAVYDLVLSGLIKLII